MLTEFQSVCPNVGVPLTEDKTVQPTTCLNFWGIETEFWEMVMRLPKEKLIKNEIENMQMLIFKKNNSKRNAVTARSSQFRM